MHVKNLIVLYLTFLTSSAFSKGYDCEALCIVLDSADSTLYYLDQVNIVAGTTKKDTHRLLKQQCRKLAKNYGFVSGSLLVDSLDYKSQRIDESESSSSSSAQNSGWISMGESRARNRQGAVYGSYHIEAGRSSSYSASYASREYRGRQLEIRMTPSSINVACIEDDDIADGNIPYTGGINIH